MVRCVIYGTPVACDVPLPELGRASKPRSLLAAEIDARIRAARPNAFVPEQIFYRIPDEGAGDWLTCARCDGGYLFSFPELADFFIAHDGSRIECCRTRDATSQETLRHLLLDVLLPRVLDLRGMHTVHATAVLTPQGACMFVGPSGAGKSTLAASFARAGLALLGDDCVVLSCDAVVMLTPGYPGTRLWEDSFQALAADRRNSALVADYAPKRRALEFAQAQVCGEPQPLRRIYRVTRPVGDAGEARPAIIALSRADAFIELLSASYRFDPCDRAASVRKFRFIEQVIAQVPFKRLVVPNDFSALPAVRELVANDLLPACTVDGRAASLSH